jgi:signal transduction histidine kinase
LLNLYSNAIKFTKKGGKITILVESLPEETLRISVHDTGLGIKVEDQKKLFTLFGSIKDEQRKINTKGIGLGLVICKMIVEKFGGQIDFKTEYCKGSTFFYTFKTDKVSPSDGI